MKAKTMLMVCSVVALVNLPFVSNAQRGGSAHGGGVHVTGGSHAGGFETHAPAAVAPHGGGGFVDRSFHGSIRHGETHVERAPEFRREPENHVVVTGPDRGYYVHHDAHVDFGGHRYWNDFHRGFVINSLPFGYLSFNIGGLPYYYYGGIYYQQGPGGYQEVYPPAGAALTAPPDGAYPVTGPNGETFYYAGGAFYMQQPDGSFISVQPPLGVIVPELPPGAVQVNLNGITAFQFGNVYYQPVFANGVTQYQTFVP